MHSLLTCFSVSVILQTALEIVAFWSLKAGFSNSGKDKTSRESLLISLKPRAARVAPGPDNKLVQHGHDSSVSQTSVDSSAKPTPKVICMDHQLETIHRTTVWLGTGRTAARPL